MKRAKAQRFMEPVKRTLREAFRNTEDTELVADYYACTPRSAGDVVIAGHGAEIAEHGQRIAALETRLGMRRATSAVGRLELVRRSA